MKYPVQSSKVSVNRVYQTGDGRLARFAHIHMLGITRLRSVTSGSLHEHTNPGIEICCVYEGEFSWVIEGRPVLLRPGEVSITLPWQRHGGRDNVLGKGSLGWVIITPRRFSLKEPLVLGGWTGMNESDQRTLGGILARNHSPFLGSIPEVSVLLSDLMAETTTDLFGRECRVNSLLSQLLILCGRAIQSGAALVRQRDPLLDKLIKQITSEPGDGWTLQKMQDTCHLKSTSLIAGFRTETGYTPLSFVEKSRIDRGKTLLVDTKSTVTDIALELGFSSSQHFAAVFRKWTGTTPTAWRRQGMSL